MSGESDIVERLREIAKQYEIITLRSSPDKSLADHMREAADEIERLRSSVAEARTARTGEG